MLHVKLARWYFEQKDNEGEMWRLKSCWSWMDVQSRQSCLYRDPSLCWAPPPLPAQYSCWNFDPLLDRWRQSRVIIALVFSWTLVHQIYINVQLTPTKYAFRKNIPVKYDDVTNLKRYTKFLPNSNSKHLNIDFQHD